MDLDGFIVAPDALPLWLLRGAAQLTYSASEALIQSSFYEAPTEDSIPAPIAASCSWTPHAPLATPRGPSPAPPLSRPKASIGPIVAFAPSPVSSTCSIILPRASSEWMLPRAGICHYGYPRKLVRRGASLPCCGTLFA
jgi:hypothetical protein